MITLIGKHLAKEGNSFIFYGPADECKSCRYKSSCINSLIEGHKYKIIEVRDVEQKCPLHDDEKVNVVVVEEADSVVYTDSKVFEGSKFTYKYLNCSNEDCDFREFCFPESIKNNDKCVFVKDLGSFDECPVNIPLNKVVVKLQ